MVRHMVGALLRVGRGVLDPAIIRAALDCPCPGEQLYRIKLSPLVVCWLPYPF